MALSELFYIYFFYYRVPRGYRGHHGIVCLYTAAPTQNRTPWKPKQQSRYELAQRLFVGDVLCEIIHALQYKSHN
jgi:hypothetical protein